MTPLFLAKLRLIGERIGKTADEMRALWRRHVEINHDQSALLSEFIQWNAERWGLTASEAGALVDDAENLTQS